MGAGIWTQVLEKQESVLMVEVSLVPELAFSIAVGGEVNEGLLEEVSSGFLKEGR